MNKKVITFLATGLIIAANFTTAEAYTQDDINNIVNEAEAKIGFPYVWGADPNNEKEFDCSSFTKHLYSHIGVELPRCSYEQSYKGTEVAFEDIEAGDLIFMHTSSRNDWANGVTHVGIAVNNTEMIHAKSRKYGVVKQDISDYKEKIVCIKRIIEPE